MLCLSDQKAANTLTLVFFGRKIKRFVYVLNGSCLPITVGNYSFGHEGSGEKDGEQVFG